VWSSELLQTLEGVRPRRPRAGSPTNASAPSFASASRSASGGDDSSKLALPEDDLRSRASWSRSDRRFTYASDSAVLLAPLVCQQAAAAETDDLRQRVGWPHRDARIARRTVSEREGRGNVPDIGEVLTF
jgi:hypothetical protein